MCSAHKADQQYLPQLILAHLFIFHKYFHTILPLPASHKIVSILKLLFQRRSLSPRVTFTWFSRDTGITYGAAKRRQEGDGPALPGYSHTAPPCLMALPSAEGREAKGNTQILCLLSRTTTNSCWYMLNGCCFYKQRPSSSANLC